MKKKPYWEMTTSELTEATRQFDEPFVVDRSRPLTPEEKKEWKRAKRKRGRPKNGQGFQRISVSMERGLLKRVTALAKKRRVSRSKLFAQVFEKALANTKNRSLVKEQKP
jgi:hypothetical protein